ncbi:MAG: hypothetical protein GDYSWBUE_000727 [Candidatus Fervidibacterota bacterium]
MESSMGWGWLSWLQLAIRLWSFWRHMGWDKDGIGEFCWVV